MVENGAYELDEVEPRNHRSSQQYVDSSDSKNPSGTSRIAVAILSIVAVVTLVGMVVVIALHLQMAEQWKKEIAEITQSNEKLSEELKKAKDRINELETGTSANSSELTTENAKLKESLKETKTELDKSVMENTELTRSLEEKTSELNKVTTEKDKLTTELNQAKGQISEWEKKNTALEAQVTKLNGDVTQANNKVTELNNKIDAVTCLRSCSGAKLEQIPVSLRNGTGGEIALGIPGSTHLAKSYCDVTTDSGNWTVFQRRMDGSVDFYLNWNDYVTGFGSPRGEFWLGLDTIHAFTKSGDKELRIDMIERGTGTYYYAKYSSFQVGPASDKYRLTVSGYSGNATDSLSDPTNSWGVHNNQQFTAKDNDNDKESYNCAERYKSGGWWFNGCFNANLNGNYSGISVLGVLWSVKGTGGVTMQSTEMKFRPKK